MVIIIHKDQSFVYPMHFSPKEYKAIFDLWIIYVLPKFVPIYTREKWVSFYLFNSVHS